MHILIVTGLYLGEVELVKTFMGPGTGGRGLDMRAGGRITQRPKNTIFPDKTGPSEAKFRIDRIVSNMDLSQRTEFSQ